MCEKTTQRISTTLTTLMGDNILLNEEYAFFYTLLRIKATKRFLSHPNLYDLAVCMFISYITSGVVFNNEHHRPEEYLALKGGHNSCGI